MVLLQATRRLESEESRLPPHDDLSSLPPTLRLLHHRDTRDLATRTSHDESRKSSDEDERVSSLPRVDYGGSGTIFGAWIVGRDEEE